jgi:hypothetical protein
MNGDVDQIIIDEAKDKQEVWNRHAQYGLVCIIQNIDEAILPYKVYKKIGD